MQKQESDRARPGQIADREILPIYAALSECHELEGWSDFKTFIRTSVRRILPHQMAVCGLGEIRSRRILRLVNVDFPSGYLQRIIRSEQLILGSPLQEWTCKRSPTIVHAGEADSRDSSPWNAAAREYGIRSIACYGVADGGGVVSSFFAFGELEPKIVPSCALLLNLIVPHLHAALVRILAMEHLNRPGEPEGDILHAPHHPEPQAQDPARFNITARERQVLHWIAAGKSNWEISRILAVSEYTVKNHVRSVLKKLSVTNRAQAVTKAISCSLLGAEPAASDLVDA